MAEIQMDGLSELLKALDELPERIKKNAVRGAIRAGCKVFANEAKQLAPIGPPGSDKYGSYAGALRDSIKARSVRFNGDWVNGRVSAGNKVAFYARWVEFGTAAHLIKPKNAKALFFGGIFAEGVNHPGAKKHPFLRPALDKASNAALEAYAAYCQRRIDKENLTEDVNAV